MHDGHTLIKNKYYYILLLILLSLYYSSQTVQLFSPFLERSSLLKHVSIFFWALLCAPFCSVVIISYCSLRSVKSLASFSVCLNFTIEKISINLC